ncbi:MAG: tetratricopeptide repeat protein, partial [Pseudomonadota bacterium]
MALLNITKIRLPAVVLGAVLLIAACADNSPDALLTKAQDARDAQDPETATIHLKNILQSNPEHIAARILLGEVSLEMADPAGAENQFRRALELGAPLEPIQLPLARAILQQGRFHDVLEFLLEHDPQQPDEIAVSLQLRGEAHYALRHLEQA